MSKLRIFKSSNFYSHYLTQFKNAHPEINDLDYKKTLSLIYSHCYGWADFWKINLEADGNFICEEVIQNADFIQKKWAIEHHVNYQSENWIKEILFAQIETFQPDILFLVDQYNDNSILKDIKKKIPSIRLILGWDGILHHNAETFKYCDVVLSCVNETVDFYRKKGSQSFLHKLGFESSILDRLIKPNSYNDVSFVGSIYVAKGYHEGRLAKVSELQRKIPIKTWISSLPDYSDIFSKRRLWDTFTLLKFQQFFDLLQVKKNNLGELFGLDMYNVLHSSKIVFNTHGDNSVNAAVNMRMTEVTGVGSCLLTDWKDSLKDVFIPDEEVVTYRTIPEAIEKIKFLLDNPVKLNEISKAGQKKTLEQYSCKIGMQAFESFIKNQL